MVSMVMFPFSIIVYYKEHIMHGYKKKVDPVVNKDSLFSFSWKNSLVSLDIVFWN